MNEEADDSRRASGSEWGGNVRPSRLNNVMSKDTPSFDLLGEAGSAAPIPKFVNLILFQAMREGASEIEFGCDGEASKASFRITFSKDGSKHDLSPPPHELFTPIRNRLCVMANLPYWSKEPVEGRFSIVVGEKTMLWTVKSDAGGSFVRLCRT